MVPKEGEVRSLTLEYGFDGSSTLYRLQHNWTLLFRLGPSLLGTKVTLMTNYPLEEGLLFDRHKYSKVPWEQEGANVKDDTCKFGKILLTLSGSFHYYLKTER